MIFWILWVIGIVITIITRLLIEASLRPFKEYMFGKYVETTCTKVSKLGTKAKILLHLLVTVCIVLVGGIAVAKFAGVFYEAPFWAQMAIGTVPAILTYTVGNLILRLDYFDDKRSQIFFVAVFIISIIGWTMLINNYNRNIEMVTETTVEQTETRELLYFCNVPVQEITGEVSGSSTLFAGNVSGSVDTTHELTYWYIGENERGLFDTAEANSSELEPIKEGETSYLEINSYYECKKKVDHNTGAESIWEEKRWKKYVFHLPETIMQHSLN